MQSTATIVGLFGSTTVRASWASDTGSVRAINEDSVLATGPVFLVADGMGGHNAGDQASRAVRDAFASAFPDDAPGSTDLVLAAIRSGNEAVRAISAGAEGRGLSGTTLSGIALVAAPETGALHWMAFNIGDSRVYSWDGRDLTQLSVDHSAVQELVDAGLITLEESVLHPDRNIITRAIGATETVDPDVWFFPASRRQSFLICSDGLTKEVGDERIAEILAAHVDAPGSSIADALVAEALAAGGRDNVTVVVVEAETSGAESDDEDTLDRLPVFEDTLPRS